MKSRRIEKFFTASDLELLELAKQAFAGKTLMEITDFTKRLNIQQDK